MEPPSSTAPRAIYLDDSSALEARQVGAGDWFEWLRSVHGVRLAGDLSELEAHSTWISFRSSSRLDEAMRELPPTVERWIWIEDGSSFDERCALAARQHINRVLFGSLPDELPTTPVPATLRFLQQRGVWLPPLESMQAMSPRIRFGASKTLVIVTADDFQDEPHVLGAGAIQCREVIDTVGESAGWSTQAISWKDLLNRNAPIDAGAAILDHQGQDGKLLGMASACRTRVNRIACWRGHRCSPLRFAFLGLPAPTTIPGPEQSVKRLSQTLLAFLSSETWESELAPESKPLDLLTALSSSGKRPFEPPVVASFLMRREGIDYLADLQSKSSRPQRRHASAAVGLEVFRQHHPLRLICDGSLTPALAAALRSLLEALRKSIAGHVGKMHLHLELAGWAALLIDDTETTLELLRSTKPYHRGAATGIAAGYALALAYRGEAELARACLEVALQNPSDASSISPSFADSSAALGLTLGGPPAAVPPAAGELTAHIARAVRLSQTGHEELARQVWRQSEEMDSIVARAFKKRFGVPT